VNLLALDTSSIACSVALQVGDVVVERHEEKPREHTRILMPMIESTLREAGVALPDLEAIVLGNGPGSFIGMRIAASVSQGLAFGAGLKIVPVSSMAAVAAQVFDQMDATEVAVAQDAHMGEVYFGLYRQESGIAVDVLAERLQSVAPVVELQAGLSGPRVAAGFGWQRYPDLLAANRQQFSAVVNVLHPRAKYLLALAPAGAAISPRAVVPAYLRQKVAQKPAQSS